MMRFSGSTNREAHYLMFSSQSVILFLFFSLRLGVTLCRRSMRTTHIHTHRDNRFLVFLSTLRCHFFSLSFFLCFGQTPFASRQHRPLLWTTLTRMTNRWLMIPSTKKRDAHISFIVLQSTFFFLNLRSHGDAATAS